MTGALSLASWYGYLKVRWHYGCKLTVLENTSFPFWMIWVSLVQLHSGWCHATGIWIVHTRDQRTPLLLLTLLLLLLLWLQTPEMCLARGLSSIPWYDVFAPPFFTDELSSAVLKHKSMYSFKQYISYANHTTEESTFHLHACNNTQGFRD